MSDLSISGRMLGRHAVSIGTSMALEAIDPVGTRKPTDPEWKPPQQVDMSVYAGVYINIATLLRNMVGAIDTKQQETITSKGLLLDLHEEMSIINAVLRSAANPNCKVTYFWCEHADLAKRWVGITLRQTQEGTKKHQIEHLTQIAIGMLFKAKGMAGDESAPLNYKVYPHELKVPANGTYLLISHEAIDLTAAIHSTHVHLLESHTALLKKQAQWHTKFNDGNALSHIPFCRAMLYVFGDNTLIKGVPKSLKQEVMAIAAKRQWTSRTTVERVVSSLNSDLRDKFALELIKKLPAH